MLVITSGLTSSSSSLIISRLLSGSLGSSLSLLSLLDLLIGSLLGILALAPGLLGELLSSGKVVRDKDVVKDGARLDLPELKSNKLGVLEVVQKRIGLELGIVNIRGNPDSLVGRVVNLLGLEIALEIRVGLGGCLPGAVLLVVPVGRLGGIRVSNGGRDVVPSGRLHILGVIDLGSLVPVLWLGGLGVLDLLGGEQVPVLLEGTRPLLNEINEDLVGVVGVEYEGVDVSEGVGLCRDVVLDEVVLALVGQDDVDLLGGVAANVGAKHDGVGGVAAKVLHLGGGRGGDELDVATAAVEVLLVLN